MVVLKNSIYRLTKYFIALLLMTNFCSAIAEAVVIKENDTDSQCFIITPPSPQNPFEICLSTTTTWHSVSTPSGNEVIKATGEDNIVFTDLVTELITFSENRSFKERSLTKQGELQNEFIRSDIIQFFDNGTCNSIVWEKKYTYVNGQILLDQENHEEIPCD